MLPLKIQTKESASNEQLTDNVLKNLNLIDKWIDNRYTVSDRKAIIVSAGKSFTRDPKGLLDKMTEGLDPDTYDIYCVKHCLPHFEGTGYTPDYCVVLDPREVEGISTLGHKRSDLFKHAHEDTKFLVASMTHSSVTEYLIKEGANIIGWHSACEAMKNPVVSKQVQKWVVGGSCSAMRAIVLARIFGVRDISLGGFDATIDEPKMYTKAMEEQLTKLLNLSGLEGKFDASDIEILKNTVVPSLEHLLSSKVEVMMKGGQDPNQPEESVIKIVDRVMKPEGAIGFMKLGIGNEMMWCTPELAAMAQDLENTIKGNRDVVFHNYSGGVLQALWDHFGGEETINPHKLDI